MSNASENKPVESPQPDPQARRAWWLSTGRRRPEWLSLRAAGTATFSGTPYSRYRAAQPGDTVLLYLARPDHTIKAVGVVTRTAESGANGNEPSIEVQLAFEVTNGLPWKLLAAEPALAEAEPVRQRSSGTLFSLLPDEYNALQNLVLSRNPELAASFAAIEAGEFPPTLQHRENGASQPSLRETAVPYISRLPEPQGVGLPPVSSLEQLEELTGLNRAFLGEVTELLQEAKQVVLSGPPGTGKTWLARGLAALVAGDPARVSVVQFHPATSYEDFIEGLKPRVDPMGRVTYAVLPGLFLRVCAAALPDPQHLYVLIVDEINRAPLSRVFGELLYALEYRGREGAVELMLSGGMGKSEPFFVPENVLLLGTMNSADRSLAMLDYALRRRFRFVELEPSAAVLDRWLLRHGSAAPERRVVLDLFSEVNRRLTEALDAEHRLGHSYFMLDNLSANALNRLWRTAIRPLLGEYFVPPMGEIDIYEALFLEAASELDELAEDET